MSEKEKNINYKCSRCFLERTCSAIKASNAYCAGPFNNGKEYESVYNLDTVDVSDNIINRNGNTVL